MTTLKFKVSKSGKLTAIYSDDLAGLLAQGEAKITRASHVEPQGAEWIADMAPVHGPVLGPFKLRSQALATEVAYLDKLLFQ